MPRVAQVQNTSELNKLLSRIDKLEKRMVSVQDTVDVHASQLARIDVAHAQPTTNNLVFTWTGGSTSLSWATGWIKDKNASSSKTISPPTFSSAPGTSHSSTVIAGSLTLSPSTHYWLGWDKVHQKMVANTDASVLFQNYNVQIVCRLFTGTAGQTGTAGGGGSAASSDLSGQTYKLF